MDGLWLVLLLIALFETYHKEGTIRRYKDD